MTEPQAMLRPPTMTWEEIEADIKAHGNEARDLLGNDGDFERWHRRRGLPTRDGEGLHMGSSREFFAQYEADPEGAEAAPPYADLWHFLLKISESLPWRDGKGSRTKTLPLCAAMLTDPPDFTEEQIQAGRARLEAVDGPLPDSAWEQFARHTRKSPAAARRCIQEIRAVLDRHGQDHPEFGRMLLVTLTAS